MKKHVLLLSAAFALTIGVNAQDISKLDWNRDIPQTEANAAYEALSGFFGTSLSAQYALRGGKENGAPESHCYQYNYCLATDNYAGYLVVSHYDFPYANANLTSTYAMHESFNSGARGQYTSVKNILVPLLANSNMNSLPELKAVNLLYYCVAAQETADISGPYTYLEDKKGVESPSVYNDMKTIYDGIVADLDNIVACLKNYKNRPDWYKKLLNQQFNSYETSRDGVTGESFVEACWRLANSLKLRMAMHIVKVDGATAQRWAEEAVASGVVESEKMQSGLYPAKTGFTNPLVEICNSWNDNRLNASFENIMMSLDHPYSKFFFKKNSMPITNKKTEAVTPKNNRIVGIRAGAHIGEGQSVTTNPYIAASVFDKENGMMNNAPLYLVKWAEVDLLRAEGAVRGWNMGGTAEEFYVRAIRNACFDEPADRRWYEEDEIDCYDNYIEEYLKLEAAKPYTQVDAYGDADDFVSPIKIGVKWNDADDNETKLEKIITQKWLALFPLSTEAWTEVRRTGYPRLIPVLNPEDGDGSLKAGDLIRRMPWAPTSDQDKANIEATGLKALGGADLQATRLWWDLDVPNFVTGIETVNKSDMQISSQDGKIIVAGLSAGEEVSIYSPEGMLIGKAKADGVVNLNTRGGKSVVIVKVGDKVKKIFVR